MLSVESSVAARKSYGGTAPENVAAQAARWKELLTGETSEPVKVKKTGGHGEGATE